MLLHVPQLPGTFCWQAVGSPKHFREMKSQVAARH